MHDLKETLDIQTRQATVKVAATREPLRFLVSSMLAGLYIGVAVVLMLCAAGPLAAAGSPYTRLVAGTVFGVGLILVVFAGAELVTSATMILTQGALAGTVRWAHSLWALVFCFIGNLLGSVCFSWLVVQSGVLASNQAAGEYLGVLLSGKANLSWSELFVRGILCNVLVCLAIWCANRLTTEIGKIIAICSCIFAFVASGFEHVVANMTTFSLGIFADPAAATWPEFGRNLLFVGLGNLVGGAVFIGVIYWFVAADKPDHVTVGA